MRCGPSTPAEAAGGFGNLCGAWKSAVATAHCRPAEPTRKPVSSASSNGRRIIRGRAGAHLSNRTATCVGADIRAGTLICHVDRSDSRPQRRSHSLHERSALLSLGYPGRRRLGRGALALCIRDAERRPDLGGMLDARTFRGLCARLNTRPSPIASHATILKRATRSGRRNARRRPRPLPDFRANRSMESVMGSVRRDARAFGFTSSYSESWHLPF